MKITSWLMIGLGVVAVALHYGFRDVDPANIANSVAGALPTPENLAITEAAYHQQPTEYEPATGADANQNGEVLNLL